MTASTSIYGFLKNPSMVDFPGRLSAVFFTSGCNFRCGFCHNATLMGKRREGLSWDRLKEACRRFKGDWVNAVSISGGEPTLAPDLLELIRFFKGHGFAVKLDSNGSNPDVLKEALPLIDYLAMDVKCALDSYPDFVHFGKPDAIARSIQLVIASGVEHEFRTTVLESYHSDAQMESIAESVRGAGRFVLQPFLPRDELPEKRYTAEPRTSPERLRELESLMTGHVDRVEVRGAGLKRPARV